MKAGARHIAQVVGRRARAVVVRPARRVLMGLISLALIPAGANALSVGEAAPRFQLQGSDGAQYTLEGVLADHDGVVLAFFPKAFTPG